MWCHVRHLNLGDFSKKNLGDFLKKNLQRITKEYREVLKKLNYEGVDFPVPKKDYGKIEVLNKININGFYYENKTIFPVYLSNQCFNDCMDLLLISSNFTSHYVYIKDFNRLMFNKIKHKGTFMLKDHKENCLMVNGKQNVKLKKGFISFKNFNIQTPVPFKILILSVKRLWCWF